MKDFTLNGESRGLCCRGCGRQDKQLNTYDWLADIPGNTDSDNMVEVQFKNTRKGYYLNANKLPLEKGDIVAVEASPGHDIGVVTLTGKLVSVQMKKANLKEGTEIRRIYRKAKPVDMEKFDEAKLRENDTMIRSRQIAKELGLQMKIGDVEYQGDGNKAIFYYIADERVDFRKLIKVLADEFHVRIEMKQIGARQEAGRIGGIGPCGRELCCATWLKNFISVSTNVARCQNLSLNPQKLAGQCAKLKCCLNYEVDTYMEALKQVPDRNIQLETQDGTFYFFKTDVLAGIVTYSSDKNLAANLTDLSFQRAFEIIGMNKRGEKPISLIEDESQKSSSTSDILNQDSLTRFDKSHRKKKKRRSEERQGRYEESVNAEGENLGKDLTEDKSLEEAQSERPSNNDNKRRNDNDRNRGERNRGNRNRERRKHNANEHKTKEETTSSQDESNGKAKENEPTRVNISRQRGGDRRDRHGRGQRRQEGDSRQRDNERPQPKDREPQPQDA